MPVQDTTVFRVLAVDPDRDALTLYRDILCYEGQEPEALEALFSDASAAPMTDAPVDSFRFEVVRTTTGAEAVQAMADGVAEGRPFALAVVEVRLEHGMDGVETAEMLREMDAGVEVLMMSSATSVPLAELNRRVQPPEKLLYLQKPFRSQEFRQVAVSLCNKWRAETELRELNESLALVVEARTEELNKANQRLLNDIAKRADVLKDLKASEERYRELFEKNITGNFLADAKGRIVDCNLAFAEVLGLASPEAAAGMSLFEIWGKLGGKEPLDELLRQRGSVRNHELSAGPRGRELLGNVDVVTNERGGHEIRGYFFDITERKRLEQQLRLAQKMESLGTLAGGIAHDFNNILGVILGYAEIIESSADEGSGLARRVGEILSAGRRARDLVTQILNFSRQSPEERQPMSLSPLLKEAFKMLRSSIPANIELTLTVDAKDDQVMADATQLHQIMLNLCTNAAQAMELRGGRVDVELADADADGPEPPEELGGPEWFVRLTVRDNGPGMDAETLERIFDPFFTTKGPGEGTGMGLAMVHGIVKRHDGHITVESEPGSGTVFHVFLPRTPSLERPQTESRPQLVFTKGRILFVDDEKALVDIGKEMLESMGFDVVTRTSSIEALEAFKYRSDDFDLVITDQSMPNMTGIELAREMVRIRPGVPIILCTGFSEAVSYERIREIGIGDFIMKPILRHEMMEAIGRLLGEKRPDLID